MVRLSLFLSLRVSVSCETEPDHSNGIRAKCKFFFGWPLVIFRAEILQILAEYYTWMCVCVYVLWLDLQLRTYFRQNK